MYLFFIKLLIPVSRETPLKSPAPHPARISIGRKRKMTDERKRRQNERKFGSWEELSEGGHRYSYEIQGRHGWFARYVKVTDAGEKTVRFWQEIYDDK